MKVDFDGQVRELDLVHVRLGHAVAVQEYTGLALLPWLTQLSVKMRAEPSWIRNMAAAHWLMTAQNEQDPPPLDDSYDCDVLGFALAYMTAVVEQARALSAEALPKAPPAARRARSSRRTPTPETAEVPPPLPPSTGS